MARLRRDSNESFRSTGFTKAIPTKPCYQPSPGIRSSPRKKPVQSFIDLTGSSNDDDDDHSRELALAPSIRKEAGKQIRLAPLNALRASTAALTLALAPTRRLQTVSRGPTKDQNAAKPTHVGGEETVVSEDLPALQGSNSGDEPEAEIEESIWCGSDASSCSDSEEELPSPGEFVRSKSKHHSEIRIEGSGVLDISKALQDPDITEGAFFCSKLPITKQPLPTSSSNKENDPVAVLRLSPRRLQSPRKQRQSTPERPITPRQLSPSKGKLQSPSKSRARIPTPPYGPSLDAFWNIETVNAWNDEYSPRKEWPRSPKKLPVALPKLSSSPTSSPHRQPPVGSPAKRTKAQLSAARSWQTQKHDLAARFLAELDRTLTGDRISALTSATGGVKILWSKTLTSTAGRANWKRETTRMRSKDSGSSSSGTATVTYIHHASIELAEKVIDAEERLLNVLAHEFCHLCTFMISGVKDRPHGPEFKTWGRRATEAFADRGVHVTTKHTYAIDYKYVWQCEGESCGVLFQRHSKSIDVRDQRCGACKGRLVQIKPVPRKNARCDVAGDGAAAVTGYGAFVKLHFAEVKAGLPGASHKEVMEALGRKYRIEKEDRVRLERFSSPLEEVAATDVDNVARVLEFVTLE